MRKRLIALMLGATMVATSLIGCESHERDGREVKNENTIRELLEYDANVNISSENVAAYGFNLEFEIKDNKFYITFILKSAVSHQVDLVDVVRIKYEVDKDTYYNFKKNYSKVEAAEEVEMVKELTTKFDPIDVKLLDENNIEIK